MIWRHVLFKVADCPVNCAWFSLFRETVAMNVGWQFNVNVDLAFDSEDYLPNVINVACFVVAFCDFEYFRHLGSALCAVLDGFVPRIFPV